MDGAARQFSEAYDAGLAPMEFVNKMRKEGTLIMGIGHRVKSVSLILTLSQTTNRRKNFSKPCDPCLTRS